METHHLINLVCVLASVFFFILWSRQYFELNDFKEKFVNSLHENNKIVKAYFYMGKRAQRLALKYNELFNKIISSKCDGDFEIFAQWARINKMADFGYEHPVDMTKIEEFIKKSEDAENSKTKNQ